MAPRCLAAPVRMSRFKNQVVRPMRKHGQKLRNRLPGRGTALPGQRDKVRVAGSRPNSGTPLKRAALDLAMRCLPCPSPASPRRYSRNCEAKPASLGPPKGR
eukprot:363965-Chlamydomonas_euryale.AAC.23